MLTPFAVKGGGHTFNPGFSSTTGVHIALSRLNGVKYHPESNSVILGMGGICESTLLTTACLLCRRTECCFDSYQCLHHFASSRPYCIGWSCVETQISYSEILTHPYNREFMGWALVVICLAADFPTLLGRYVSSSTYSISKSHQLPFV